MTRLEFVEKNLCPLCGGRKSPGRTTLVADKGQKVLVVRQVPALICDQCGEEWIENSTYAEVESVISSLEQKSGEVLVGTLAG